MPCDVSVEDDEVRFKVVGGEYSLSGDIPLYPFEKYVRRLVELSEKCKELEPFAMLSALALDMGFSRLSFSTYQQAESRERFTKITVYDGASSFIYIEVERGKVRTKVEGNSVMKRYAKVLKEFAEKRLI